MVETACNYEWHISSRPAEVPPLVRDVLATLEVFGLTGEENSDIKLMLNELMFNAVLHGNRSDENKFVHISLAVEDSSVRISVTDEGEGFDAAKILADAVKYREERLTRESGRGLAIVAALADCVKFNREGRQITIIKRVKV